MSLEKLVEIVFVLPKLLIPILLLTKMVQFNKNIATLHNHSQLVTKKCR